MPSMKIAMHQTHGAHPQTQLRAKPSAAWLLIALTLVALAALLGIVAEPPSQEERGLAAPETPRVLEDWRGNSAGFEPLAP